MAKPTAQQSHVDRPLTNLSVAYQPDPALFIADRVFPMLQVQKQSDKYFIFAKHDWFRRGAAVRAPGTRATRGDYSLSTGSYTCVERAIAKQVTNEEIDNADSPLMPLRTATEWVTSQLFLEIEKQVANDAFGTGWSASATPSPVWSSDTATIIEDVETAKNTVVTTIGREANVGTMGRGLWRYVKQHPEIVDRIKGAAGPSSPAIVTLQAVAALFELDELLIGRQIENTALEGATTNFAGSYIWGNHMLVHYRTRGQTLNVPNSGYILTWQSREISRFVEDQERAQVVEARMSWTELLTATDAGYRIVSAA